MIERPNTREHAAARKQRLKKNLSCLGILALLAGLAYGGVHVWNWAEDLHRTTTVEVTGHQWERAIPVEQYGEWHGERWCDGMPDDAYGVVKLRKQSGTKEVYAGEDIRVGGDGELEFKSKYRDEPVYDQWCEFTYIGWKEDRRERMSGDGLDDLRWPGVTLAEGEPWPEELSRGAPSQEGAPLLGAEREGTRIEEIEVRLETRKGRLIDCDVDEASWRDMPVGSRWRIEAPLFGKAWGHRQYCETLEPAD